MPSSLERPGPRLATPKEHDAMYLQIGLFMLAASLCAGALIYYEWTKNPRRFKESAKVVVFAALVIATIVSGVVGYEYVMGYRSTTHLGTTAPARVRSVLPAQLGQPGRLMTSEGSFALEYSPKYYERLYRTRRDDDSSMLSQPDAHLTFRVGECYRIRYGASIESAVDDYVVIDAYSSSCDAQETLLF